MTGAEKEKSNARATDHSYGDVHRRRRDPVHRDRCVRRDRSDQALNGPFLPRDAAGEGEP